MFLSRILLTMHHSGFAVFVFTMMTLTGSQNAFADINKTMEHALKLGQDDAKYGQIKFDLRYRYENANTAGSAKQTANADTIRLRMGYLTPTFANFQAYAEFIGNQDVFNNNYNSTRNGKTQYDVIADPQQNELNQLWFTYTGFSDTNIKVGRQNIILDNARFIGNIGWRQMDQTFDAITVSNKSLPHTTVKAGYILNTRDIFSKENDMDTQFVNIGYTFKGFGQLTAYTYLVDYQEPSIKNANSNQTYGLRFNGAFQLNNDVKMLYTAEYAWQKDLADNPNSYEVDYIHLMGGISAYGFTLKTSMEQLGGQDAKGFDFPLGTNHAYQGWADVFLTTPAEGIRDYYVALRTKALGINVMGVYHNFDDDTGNTDYGQEFDFVISRKFGQHYSLLAKYAYYNAENFGVDTQRIWLQGGIHF